MPMRVSYTEMKREFDRVLCKVGFAPERAATCAEIFAQASLDGVASHGLNRFPGFIRFIQQGYVVADAEPECTAAFGAWEQWDGHLGPGPLNALVCTERALELARANGVGCVALCNTNHWMRGGTYGWRAAQAGFAFLCWTNTTPNMPAWGARACHLGNNPFVLAVPRQEGPVVLDMAMSQFSYGRLTVAERSGEQLPVPGGFDADGNLTTDPGAIHASMRPLPIGYWKGSGLSLLLDLIAALLSGGQTTYQIGQQETEYGVSQVYVAFDLARAGSPSRIDQLVDEVIRDLHGAAPDVQGGRVRYPGERALRTREENLARGIPVDPDIWEQVQVL